MPSREWPDEIEDAEIGWLYAAFIIVLGTVIGAFLKPHTPEQE